MADALTPRQEMAAKLGWITAELRREGHRLWRALDTLGDEILDEFERLGEIEAESLTDPEAE